jgi:predicted HicB family RNase H-like nuclease
MENDDEWFRFKTPNKRAIRVAILPEIATALAERARTQGVSVETLVNAILIERLQESAVAS